MTLPSSPNRITYTDVNAEIGNSGHSLSMTWIRANSKTAVGGSAGTIHTINGVHGLAYYNNSNGGLGACNNSNCSNPNCGGGNIQCANCSDSAINCAVADTQSWLQPNCNCDCTYNCDQVADQSYNCNCNCDCLVCACACSDETLKYNVRTIDSALDKVSALRGVYFNWNANAANYGKPAFAPSTGVMADETEKTLPEVVSMYRDKKTVDYGAINGLLIEAIKELKEQVDKLTPKDTE